LTREAGATPNQPTPPLEEDVLFRDYARVCLHLGKIPSTHELRGATRELGTRTHQVYERFGNISAFDRRFLAWLIQGPEEFKAVLSMPGWRRKGPLRPPPPPLPAVSPFPFLPAVLQNLEALARGDGLVVNSTEEWANQVFGQRCRDAFRALGFDVRQLGPGKDPQPDRVVMARPFHIALARSFHYAVLLDTQPRPGDYVLPTDGPEFYERVSHHALCLKQDGIEKTYLAVIGPSFRETDLEKLAEYLREAGLSGITLLAAAALMRIVADSIRQREFFTLAQFEETLAGYSLAAS
jgi:hypothetical protein